MSRQSAGANTTSAPTATLPGLSLYAIANVELKVVQVEVYNTTTTACAVSLCAFSTAGTPGTALTEQRYEPGLTGVTIFGTAFNTHTSTPPTLVGDANGIASAYLGAAIGAGVIWNFADYPIMIPAGTANGVGILCPTGTGQIVRVVFTWDE